MKTPRFVTLLAATASVVALMAPAATAKAATGSENPVVDRTWEMRLDDVSPAVAGRAYFTISADGAFSGRDGCNRVFGTAVVTADTITVRNMGQTQMYCEGADVQKVVNAFHDTFDHGTVGYVYSGAWLYVKGQNGTTRFERRL